MNQPNADASKPIEILIAEDSPTQAEQLKYYLTERAYRVAVARNGREALALALESRPAMIITDVVMPEMDGYTLCKEIKSRSAFRDIPVILLTSLSRPQDVLRGLECGADNFIRKPYDEKYLLSRVDYILANLQLRQTGRMQLGVQLYFGGQQYFITAEKQQILDLLISTYEGAVEINDDLEKKQKELEAANRELEAFSYSVSHDLRAPLRQINAYSTLFLENYATQLEPEAQEFLQRIKDSAMDMNQMVDDLLNLSRVGRELLGLERTDLNALVESARRDLERDLSGRQIEWRVGKLPTLECDPGLMKSVFANLLSNATKYTRRRDFARIEIDQMTLGDDTVIFVRDNGAGFNPKYAHNLFGVFRRLHRAEEFEGTGVGLATVQRIIHKHGGRIWAEAEVEKGATFFFTLQTAAIGPTGQPL
ncbi:MAG TPA: response regulator [Terriglobia bacterium]|nr:response regulator [Terriglobia bacterium]